VAIVELDDALNRLNIDDDDGELQDFIDALAVPVENHLREIVVPRARSKKTWSCAGGRSSG
jgi:hypothetical protein